MCVSGLGLALGLLWVAPFSTGRAGPRSEIDQPKARLRAAPSNAGSEALARADLAVMKFEVALLRKQLRGLRAKNEALERELGQLEPALLKLPATSWHPTRRFAV
jgi:hypothetical protein